MYTLFLGVKVGVGKIRVGSDEIPLPAVALSLSSRRGPCNLLQPTALRPFGRFRSWPYVSSLTTAINKTAQRICAGLQWLRRGRES